MSATPSLRLIAANLLTAALYGLLAHACLTLATLGPHISPVWLPAGLGLAALVIAGPRLLPGLWLGQAAITLSAGAPWYVAGLIGVCGAAAAWCGAWLTHRFLPEGFSGSPRAPFRFLAIAYGCSALAGLSGPLVLQLAGQIPPGALDSAIIVWWLGDALGVVVLAPALLAWREAAAAEHFVEGRGLDTLAVAAVALLLALVTFVGGRFFLPSAHLQAALLLPLMMWLTVRSHPAVPLSVNVVAVTALVYGATGSLGPLLGDSLLDRSYALHGFVILASVTLLVLAAHVHRTRQIAAAAQAGEERFRRLTTLSSDWYWEQDAELRFTAFEGPVFGNPATEPPLLLGKRRWELPGVTPYGTTWEAHRADLAARRTFVGLILRHALADGGATYYTVSGEPVFDRRGAFAGYRGVGKDVTAEIESREALAASERRFHEVADATFEGLLIHDYGRVVFVNQALAEQLARREDDIVGCSILDFIPAEEHSRLLGEMTQDQEFKHFETVALRAGGSRFPVEVFGKPFVFQGKPMRIVAVRDIAERRAAEKALAAQAAFLRILLDTIPSPVFYKNRDGRYLGYNQSFADTFGIGLQDYIGKTVFDIAPPELAAQYKAADDKLFANPATQIYEAQIATAQGRRDVMFHKAVFTDAAGNSSGLIGIILDITERKRSEDRLRRFQELSPAAFAMLDTNGKLMYLNPAAVELFGYSRAEAPTLDAWWRLVYPDPDYRETQRSAWFAALERTLQEGRSTLRFKSRMRCRDGRVKTVATLTSVGEDEVFVVFTDLSEYLDGAPE
ncbi:MAG: PAS domain S-box protein [Sterolibacteriaceae bacterium MAG5]|nr:PAS domain S-box protein [Candidatus Nitricoxidireducens bremensis]